jgi:UDP-N-acetylmuramoyl-tripeptide--D-alanyl-D-alanine ligase
LNKEMGFPILSVDEILKATGGSLITGRIEQLFHGLSTDSRNLFQGNLFVPLKGENYDGHDFLALALKEEASGALIQEDAKKKIKAIPKNSTLIAVADTLKALGDIAHFWRMKFDIPVIALTGSSGKTTTKEMIASIAGLKKNILKTEGNLNNLIGLPKTLLQMNGNHDVAILEVGTNCRGEIARLTEIAKPDIGLITNVGPAHLEGLKSFDVIREEKGDIFLTMANKGTAVINRDDEAINILEKRWKGGEITFGLKNRADVSAHHIKNDYDGAYFTLVMGQCEKDVKLSTPGVHNIYNALAAVASSLALGIDQDTICQGLSIFRPVPGRMEISRLKNGAFLINDTYNANPASAAEALKALKALRKQHRSVVILGDMLELGEQSMDLHEYIGRLLADTGTDAVFLRGRFSQATAAGALKGGLSGDQLFMDRTSPEIVTYLKSFLKKDDWVLVKGSRKMKMEEIVQDIVKTFGPGKEDR